MSRFVTKGDTKVIRAPWWDDSADEWVRIRKWTIKQKDALDSQILHIAGAAGSIPEVVVRSVTVPYLLAGVSDWSFRDSEGKRVPVTADWIEQLTEEDADFIAGEIRAFNEGRTTAEQQEFLRQLTGRDSDEGEIAAGVDAHSGDEGDGVELE